MAEKAGSKKYDRNYILDKTQHVFIIYLLWRPVTVAMELP